MRRLCFRLSGTSPSAMRRARPSTMAVLPTPGSPIRTGLFLVRRDSTWMTRRISSSRPMTGSILPSAGDRREVTPVALEGLELLLGVLAGDTVAAADLPEGGRAAPRGRHRAGRPWPAAGARPTGSRRAAPCGRPRPPRTPPWSRGSVGLAGAEGLGQLGHGFVGPVAHHERREAELLHDGQHDRVVLAEQGGQEVVGRDLGVAVAGAPTRGRPRRPAGSSGSRCSGRAPSWLPISRS